MVVSSLVDEIVLDREGGEENNFEGGPNGMDGRGGGCLTEATGALFFVGIN